MHDISPSVEEFSEARELIEESLRTAAAAIPIETELRVEIGWNGEEYVVEEMDGALGVASYPDRVELEFNTNAEDWRPSLKSSTVHEYGHIYVYETRERESEQKWEYILEEAFTQHFADRLVPEYRSPWWHKHSRREVGRYWERIRDTEMTEESEEAGPVFIDPTDGGYPHGLGYSMSYQLGEELLAEYDLRDFPAVSRAEVVRVGNRLYGD